MKTYVEKCPFHPGKPECTNYVLYTLEDWDEYEQILKAKGDFLKWNPNFYSFKEDFMKYIGKIWSNEHYYFHTKKGKPVGKYKIIGMEDSNSMQDWYFLAQNIDDDRDIEYILVNSHDIDEGLN